MRPSPLPSRPPIPTSPSPTSRAVKSPATSMKKSATPSPSFPTSTWSPANWPRRESSRWAKILKTYLSQDALPSTWLKKPSCPSSTLTLSKDTAAAAKRDSPPRITTSSSSTPSPTREASPASRSPRPWKPCTNWASPPTGSGPTPTPVPTRPPRVSVCSEKNINLRTSGSSATSLPETS